MTSLLRLKTENESRLAEEKREIDRKRSLLVLIVDYCLSSGYRESAEKLQQEAGISLHKFTVADNMDLLSIIKEYENYYEMYLSKKPKLIRKLSPDEGEDSSKQKGANAKASAAERRHRRNTYTSPNIPEEGRIENNVAVKTVIKTTGGKVNTDLKEAKSNNNHESPVEMDLGISGQKQLIGARNSSSTKHVKEETVPESDDYEQRLLRPLPSFNNDSELKALAETITRDIFQNNPNVRWDDVIELETPKRLLKEAVIMPIKYPELFQGLLSPWCGILLYGPPGTGKTMLAKAVATECKTTFFNISASSIVSKFRGDSEKLVRMLFELARYHSPSTIFIDEIDSLMSQRGGGNDGAAGEHEASRRMKTELLIQMDGLAKSKELVFLLAASNLPWELDMALLRRLEKRVLVPLPQYEGRKRMIEKHITPYAAEGLEITSIAEHTAGYSGADIKLLVKEAAMCPVRRIMDKLENMERIDLKERNNDWKDLLEKVTISDFTSALEKTKPSAQHYAERYLKWEKEFGSN